MKVDSCRRRAHYGSGVVGVLLRTGMLLASCLFLVDRNVNALGSSSSNRAHFDGVSVSPSLLSPRELVLDYLKETNTDEQVSPLTRTILCVPPSCYCADDTLVYTQVATQSRIQGLEVLQKACDSFERDFQSELGVSSSVSRVSFLSQSEVVFQWNVTWVPPTAAWLEGLGNVWPGVEVIPTPYNHLSTEVSTFSWSAVGRLFSNVLQNQRLQVPLACIEGTTQLQFVNKNDDGWTLRSIREELSYAQDLQRGRLRNRRCAADLRLFLETARRMDHGDADRGTTGDDEKDWDDVVATCLPWQSVPGSNPLDLEPSEEGPEAALVALGLAAIIMVTFANVMAPLLLGQSLFGPPTYIVPPSELNSLF
mmetsp:Transcript_11346/g.20683  ORF Transcript_11346/g.20683 Transcript_11346/m.20683 type:complete len:366 (-) Transcript_11346:96-1193(-)|eukprot:CAMPEP_0198280018 /NCGR_PEP_ID=MMETSP1449-20131203/196_1 /TAXON_ID=420275 /ORGANISM="Attheya septentrionalis, Strain CCMP2084" /LENGTH=365 /DNA_ID=CAMNT_0043975281 /DNA_START=75 /DNA_END=1172 /DNA_ORIENTATION=+